MHIMSIPHVCICFWQQSRVTVPNPAVMLLVLWLPLIMSVYVCRQEADGTLDCISMALTCTFNRWGTLLAVGCNDGRIVIWDFLTRGIAKIISAHIHPVCSLW